MITPPRLLAGRMPCASTPSRRYRCAASSLTARSLRARVRHEARRFSVRKPSDEVQRQQSSITERLHLKFAAELFKEWGPPPENTAETMSSSSSPSRFAVSTAKGVRNDAVDSSLSSNSPSPTFSYHANVLDEVIRTSRSPSPSRFAAWTSVAPSASSVNTSCSEKSPFPKFSYHAILLSKYDVESTSRSPSPSRSAAWASVGPRSSSDINRARKSFCLQRSRTTPPCFRCLAPILHERCGVGEIFPYRRRNKESNAVLASRQGDSDRFPGFQRHFPQPPFFVSVPGQHSAVVRRCPGRAATVRNRS